LIQLGLRPNYGAEPRENQEAQVRKGIAFPHIRRHSRKPTRRQLRNQKVEGRWRHGGVLIRDNLVKLVVDAPDVVSNRRWMKQYKERWRSQLEQTELWMVSYAVEVE